MEQFSIAQLLKLNKEKLDVIQSSALRITCGPRKTTPIISLKVEKIGPRYFYIENSY